MRKFYTNANMLIRKFFKCTVDVKCYLFKTYCSTLYCSAMWFDSTKSAMKKLKVAVTAAVAVMTNDVTNYSFLVLRAFLLMLILHHGFCNVPNTVFPE